MKRVERSLAQFAAIPVLLVWGMRDPVLGPDVLQTWQRIFPGAERLEIDDASHFLQEDAGDRVVGRIMQFLETHP